MNPILHNLDRPFDLAQAAACLQDHRNLVFLDSAMRIAAALNVSVEDLFELSHPAEEFYAKAEIVDATGEGPVAGGDGAPGAV